MMSFVVSLLGEVESARSGGVAELFCCAEVDGEICNYLLG